MRILAVDDDELTLSILPILLAYAGYTDVTLCNSAEAALKQIESGGRTYDCFFFDISMPFMHGIDLCRKVRTLPGYSQTPIIMLTAFAETSDMNEAYAAGATDYITKPFDLMEIGERAHKAQSMICKETAVPEHRPHSSLQPKYITHLI